MRAHLALELLTQEAQHYCAWDTADYQRLNLQPAAPLAAQVVQQRQESFTIADDPGQKKQREINILDGVGEGKLELS